MRVDGGWLNEEVSEQELWLVGKDDVVVCRHADNIFQPRLHVGAPVTALRDARVLRMQPLPLGKRLPRQPRHAAHQMVGWAV